MDTYDIDKIGEADRIIMARVFWEHVIHPMADVSYDDETGEVVSIPRLDSRGREILSTVPVELSVPFEKPEPLHLRIRKLVLHELSQRAVQDEMESFEDFEDFGEDEDETGFSSPYELPIDNIPVVDDIRPNSGVQPEAPSGGDSSTTAAVQDGNNSTQTG